jgi:cation-transporting ATPase I
VLSPRQAVSSALRAPGAVGRIAGDALERLNPGRRHRRVWVSEGRAHIEVRAVDRPGHDRLVKDLEAALNAVEGVDWAQVNAVLGRVVVVFDPDAPSLDDLVEEIEGIEEAHEVGDERFPHDRPEHPSDLEPLRRDAIALGADVVGLGASVFGQVLRATPFPIELASLVSLVDTEPHLRGFLEQHLGAPATDLGLGLSNALVQALAQGPLGLVVDIGQRANLVRESQERRRGWERREFELHTQAMDKPPRALAAVERPVPLPGGPLEHYASRAAVASLGLSGVALALTGSPRRAASFVVAGLPKAGRMGREAFASSFGRQLARRDVLIVDRTILRRLDRIDLVLLDAEVVIRRSVLGSVEAIGSTTEDLRAVASDLFDEASPGRVRRRGAWAFGRLEGLKAAGAQLPQSAAARARFLGRGGVVVLALEHRGVIVGLATVDKELDPLAEALVGAARRGGLDVAVAGGGARLAEQLGSGRSLPGGRRMANTVRALQLEGHAVLLVSGIAEGLRAADCGVGITCQAVPWGADLLTNNGMADAHFVVEAVSVARAVSTRSAILALTGSGIGGVWSLVGPAGSAGRRAALPVNVAALAAQAQAMASAEVLRRRPAPVPRSHTPWHAMDGPAVMAELETTPGGLSPQQAAARRVDNRSAPPSALRLPMAIAAELANPLTPLLAVGAGLAAAVGSITDAGLVAGVMGANAVIGGVQRVRAEVSIERLAEVSDALVVVRRAGEPMPVGRQELVRGDLVELAAGEVVPADCRILEAEACEVDESVVTGESLPVVKQVAAVPGAAVADRYCMLYEGTTVSNGWAVAVVVAVGSETEVGRSLADAPEPPPSGVEARLSTLTAVTLPATVASGLAVAGMSLLRGHNPRRAISSGVSLMVAAVPEGLPLVASVAQMAAAQRLSERGALVRNPRTIEALGRVDTLCFDKTGTLTLGEISLQCVSDGATDERIGELGRRSRAVLTAALRASPDTGSEDLVLLPHATDRAVLAGAQTAGVTAADGLGGWDVLGELAFDPARGFHAVIGTSPAGARVSVKGAPEVILPRCTSWVGPEGPVLFDAPIRRRLEAEVERLARRGLRVLAIAERPASNRSEVGDERVSGMELLGFIGLADSVRPTAAAAVVDLRAAGIDVVMITGDHPSTARAIGAELGIVNGHRVVTGPELDAMSDAQLDAALGEVSVFARVTPTDKVRIVRAYQRLGRVVAMTGDGANDAPAIRLAHAGIALGDHCSAAAREAADLVVVDDRIETILSAIVEGRALWASVRDALAILVGGNMGEVAFTVIATALAGDSPLGARQLLLVNLLTDMLPAMTIAMRPPANRSPEMLLHEGPDASLGSALVSQIALRGTMTAGGALGAWLVARSTGTQRRASTVSLVALIGAQLGQTAAVGGSSPLVLASTVASAAALAAIVQTPVVSQFFGCTPLGPVGWGISAGAAAAATGASVAAPWALDRLGRSPASALGEMWDLEALRAGLPGRIQEASSSA